MRATAMAAALAGLAAGCCGPCSDPRDVPQYEISGSPDRAGDPVSVEPGVRAEAPGDFEFEVANRTVSAVELDGRLDRVFDASGREHGVQVLVTADARCSELPDDRIGVGEGRACLLRAAALAGDAYLPLDPTAGSTIVLRLAVRVGGGDPVLVDEQIALGARSLRQGVCGE